VAETRIISVIGRKDSGKTTLVTALSADFQRRGKSVGTIKHSCHHPNIDTEGTDTWRHFNEGNANQVIYETAEQRVIFERQQQESDPVDLTKKYLMDNDIVLVEGFKTHNLPKIEVVRKESTEPPLYDPAAPNASNWIALVTDRDDLDFSIPVFRFRDTAWMVTLSQILWAKAKIVTT
jgi:molybdopterin-guanine dinucleotide biosynthesis protein MobB